MFSAFNTRHILHIQAALKRAVTIICGKNAVYVRLPGAEEDIPIYRFTEQGATPLNPTTHCVRSFRVYNFGLSFTYSTMYNSYIAPPFTLSHHTLLCSRSLTYSYHVLHAPSYIFHVSKASTFHIYITPPYRARLPRFPRLLHIATILHILLHGLSMSGSL